MFEGKLPGRETQVRFLRFVVVGGTAMVVQILVLMLVERALEANLALTVSFICSSATHYTLNRFWALPSARRDSWKQFYEYLGTAGVSYLINLGLFNLCFNVFGLGVRWSGFLAIPPSTLVVFLVLNYRVFRRKHGEVGK